MSKFFDRLFNRAGRTPKKSEHLLYDSIPSYLKLGNRYEVIEGPIEHSVVTLVGDVIYMYLIRCVRTREVFYLRTPHELPKTFWIRKIVAFCEQYEILDGDDEGTLKQFIRAREKDMEQELAPA